MGKSDSVFAAVPIGKYLFGQQHKRDIRAIRRGFNSASFHHVHLAMVPPISGADLSRALASVQIQRKRRMTRPKSAASQLGGVLSMLLAAALLVTAAFAATAAYGAGDTIATTNWLLLGATVVLYQVVNARYASTQNRLAACVGAPPHS